VETNRTDESSPLLANPYQWRDVSIGQAATIKNEPRPVDRSSLAVFVHRARPLIDLLALATSPIRSRSAVLRGRSGAATNRSKPSDNVPILARVASEPRGDDVSASTGSGLL